MTTSIGTPLSKEYLILSNEIDTSLKSSSSKSQGGKAAKAMKLMIDDLLKIMVFDLIEQVSFKPFAKKLIKQVGAIMQKVFNVLIDKVIAKLNNRELEPLVNHFKNMEIDFNNQTYLAFPIDDKLSKQINDCLVLVEEEKTDVAKIELEQILLSILYESIEVFVKQTMSLLKLGIVAKKVLDMVYLTIDKTIPSAVRKIVSGMNQEELESFRDFLMQFILTRE